MEHSEAMEYLKKMHEEADSQPAETTSTEGPSATGVQNVEIETPAPESDVNEDRESPEAEEPETAAKDKEQHPKKPSKQEKINYAFKREKSRHKAELEARDKRIAELVERIKKFEPLEQGDFDPNNLKPYIDHKIALQGERSELETLKRERAQIDQDMRQREATERHTQQVNECFGSDEEREHYWTLLRNGGAKFKEFLNTHDLDAEGNYSGVIDNIVGDSPIAPLMISTLMRNPDILKPIVEMRNPMRKAFALQHLENRLKLSMRFKGDKSRVTQQQQKSKPSLPITGSQVQNPGASAESTKRDWNRYLLEHPRGMG